MNVNQTPPTTRPSPQLAAELIQLGGRELFHRFMYFDLDGNVSVRPDALAEFGALSPENRKRIVDRLVARAGGEDTIESYFALGTLRALIQATGDTPDFDAVFPKATRDKILELAGNNADRMRTISQVIEVRDGKPPYLHVHLPGQQPWRSIKVDMRRDPSTMSPAQLRAAAAEALVREGLAPDRAAAERLMDSAARTFSGLGFPDLKGELTKALDAAESGGKRSARTVRGQPFDYDEWARLYGSDGFMELYTMIATGDELLQQWERKDEALLKMIQADTSGAALQDINGRLAQRNRLLEVLRGVKDSENERLKRIAEGFSRA